MQTFPHDGKSFTASLKEEILFFPTIGRRGTENSADYLPLHGWYYNYHFSKADTFIMKSFRRALSRSVTREIDEALYKERASFFLANSTPCDTINVTIEGTRARIDNHSKNGHLRSQLSFPELQRLPADRDVTICFRGHPENKDSIVGDGRIQVLSEEGISIISDIDDTIKISNVIDKKALLRNTFFYSYEPFEEIASLYASWHDQGARFHYVSTSPWQLYRPLAQFLSDNKFPDGSHHLNSIFWKDFSWVNLFRSPAITKQANLETLFQLYPRRSFILVGDSGEKDPEIYASLYQRYSKQIVHIFIRALNESNRQQIERITLKDVPVSDRSVFYHTEELNHNLDAYVPSALAKRKSPGSSSFMM